MRKPTVLLIGLVVGALCFAGVAHATGVVRPTKVTASVSPPHRNKAPYKYTIRGRLTFPSQVCAPGTTASAYCIPLTAAEVCHGLVKVKIHLDHDGLLKRSNYVLTTARARIRSNCTYKVTTKLKASAFTARKAFGKHTAGRFAHLTFSPRFGGNAILSIVRLRNQHVVAQARQP